MASQISLDDSVLSTENGTINARLGYGNLEYNGNQV
jgi:hypothetical protein